GDGAATNGAIGATCCRIIYRLCERLRTILMKKIGILFGQEHSFPPAFVERVNQKTGGSEIVAEFVKIDKVIQGGPCGYDVVIDRISQDVPFYRAWLKNAALAGTAVVNNPFWWSADEKFFNNALATKIGVAVPRTVLLPSNQPPPDTNDKSFRTLGYPIDWEGLLCYQTEWQAPKKILQEVERGVLTLNQYLGYDLNTVEFAIRDGVPLAIDFCNPAPDAEAANVGQANFEWVVEAVSEMAIRKAREHKPGRDNLSWGKFLQAAVTQRSLDELR